MNRKTFPQASCGEINQRIRAFDEVDSPANKKRTKCGKRCHLDLKAEVADAPDFAQPLIGNE